MNFNNIPKGLLAPLFFGEISINGNVPDSLNNGGTNPPISCEGATHGIRFFSFSSPMLVYVDDELLIDAPYGYKDEVLWGNYDIDLYSDDSGLLSLLNNGTTARRIKFFLHDDAEPNVQDNPTFVDLGNNIYGFCLAPNQNQISCEGATNQLDLSMSGNFPELSITVNEVTRVFADTGSPSDELENGGVGNRTPHIVGLIEYMWVNYPDILIYVSCGGGLNFVNASLVTTYRISLACLDENYFDWVSPDNPTAQLSNGNTVVSFCLAPSTSEQLK